MSDEYSKLLKKINGRTSEEDLFLLFEKYPELISQQNDEGEYPVLISSQYYMYEDLTIYLMKSHPQYVMRQVPHNNSIMHRAVFTGCYFLTKIILEYNTDFFINIKGVNNSTPLNIACFSGRYDIIELLLDTNKVSINDKDTGGYSALNTFVRNSLNYRGASLRSLKLLLSYPDININIRDNKGGTPLHAVIGEDNTSYLKGLLLLQNIEINAVDLKNNTALHYAAKNHYVKTIKLLIKHPDIDINIKNNKKESPLYLSIIGTECQYDSSSTDSINAVRILINNGANISIDFHFPKSLLHEACRLDRSEVVYILLKKYNETSDTNKFDYVNHIDTQNRNESLLHSACRYEALQTVEMLVTEPNININAKDINMNTPLMIAIRRKYKILQTNNVGRIVKKLLEMGADASISNVDGDTPLHKACEVGNVTVVIELLKRRNIIINAMNNSKETPLSKASKYGSKEMASQIFSMILNDKRTILNDDKDIYYPIYFHPIVHGNLNALEKIMNHEDIQLFKTSSVGQTILYYALRECIVDHSFRDYNKKPNENVTSDSDDDSQDVTYGDNYSILKMVFIRIPNRNLFSIMNNKSIESIYDLLTYNKRKRGSSKKTTKQVITLIKEYMFETRKNIYKYINLFK